MLALVPKLHDLVGSAASRNLAQLRELGVDPSDRFTRIAVVVEPSPSPGRWLMATTLIDMLLRLDPLVGEVIVDAPGMDESGLAGELATRLPLEVRSVAERADFAVGVGAGAGGVDLLVDAAGWVAAIGESACTEDDGNPIGPLAGVTLAAAEAFKWAFGYVYPERAALLEMTPWRGIFSFFSYDLVRASPPLPDVRIATTLIGVGGVGAGFVRAIAALGSRVSGSLDLVDNDRLTTDNLNRVSFATLAAALAGTEKVVEAESMLRRHCPNLAVTGHPETFDAYKQRIPRRVDRRYDVVVTGLDDDEIRWQVQRDLPRVLIDGSTGRDMIARVERVEFGRYGCLGCSRRAAPMLADAPVDCDAPTDDHAPSLSFLSALPGILAAGEVIKQSTGVGSLQGHFDHVFRYGPNPDLAGMPAIRPDCHIGCSRPSKLDQYREKYPTEDLPH
ncbi:MAG: ThiF family adenylyltransferase [Mycobacteriales bacterium]